MCHKEIKEDLIIPFSGCISHKQIVTQFIYLVVSNDKPQRNMLKKQRHFDWGREFFFSCSPLCFLASELNKSKQNQKGQRENESSEIITLL